MAFADVEVITDMEVEATTEQDAEVSTFIAEGFVPLDGSVTDEKLDPNGIKKVVQKLVAGGAVLDSPMFVGMPTAPTAAAGNNTEQVATTAFVQQELGTIDAISVARIHEITGMGD